MARSTLASASVGRSTTSAHGHSLRDDTDATSAAYTNTCDCRKIHDSKPMTTAKVP
ncbi:MAG: hypothetical protein V9G12_01055 [Microthrixaceae bacterium]